MTDERYKAIMTELGMPNSMSLLSALKQVANEVGQTTCSQTKETCAQLCEAEAQSWRDSAAEGSESLAYEDIALEEAAARIRRVVWVI